MVETYENDILSSGNVSNVKRIFLSVILEDGKKKINITDYIKEKEIDKIKVLTVAEMFGEAIKKIFSNESVSVLF